jgi:hypothetical protein
MPKWIHDRADHIRTKNPGMPKSQSFAIATQQAYAAGKAPKDYGTKKGRGEAHKKYERSQSSYTQTADPKTKTSAAKVAFYEGFADELMKISAVSLADVTKTISPKKRLPRLTSVPTTTEKDPPAATHDQLAGARVQPPPPVRV